MSLDLNCHETAYLLGRWFSLLEKLQRNSDKSAINTTIRDRYYTAASVTPGLIFTRLVTLSKHHLRRIEHKKLRNWWDNKIGEVVEHLPAQELPKRLSLQEQGLFHLGYYHQQLTPLKEIETETTDILE